MDWGQSAQQIVAKRQSQSTSIEDICKVTVP